MRTTLALTAIVPAALASPAVAGTLIAVDNVFRRAWTVNTTTGELTEIGPLADIAAAGPGIAGLAVDPTRNIIYGAPSEFGRVYALNPFSGRADLFANMPYTGPSSSRIITGMTYDDATGRLLGVDSRDNRLYHIDTDNEQYTTVGFTGDYDGMQSLTIDPATRTLYAVALDDDALIAIDADTGAATEIATVTEGITGLAFDEDSGLLFGFEFNGRNIVTIDPATGAVSVVGLSATPDNPLGNPYISGLAFYDPAAFIPAPGAPAVLLAALPLAARRR